MFLGAGPVFDGADHDLGLERTTVRRPTAVGFPRSDLAPLLTGAVRAGGTLDANEPGSTFVRRIARAVRCDRAAFLAIRRALVVDETDSRARCRLATAARHVRRIARHEAHAEVRDR